jgi:formylglycine-generating enzyme required for sulfatase activity
MPNNPKTYILDDQWTNKDALDFTPYVETLADIIQTGNTPLTIGVFGTWGSGKTSLMRMVKNGIPKSKYKGLPKRYTVAWFDAWKYDKEETLWRAFILSVLTAVRSRIKKGQPTEDLDYLETMLYRAIEIEKAGGVTIDLAKLGGSVAQGIVQLGLSFIPGGAAISEFVKKVQELGAESLTDDVTDAIQRERTKIHIEQVRFLEQFQDKFRILVEQHISNNGGRLVVFVDDLDRCLPEKAIEVLEAIKLFLDAENCVFMLGLDQGVIARGIEMKYKEFGDKKDVNGQPGFTIEGIKYLEKIIQLPFQIPPVEQNDMDDFVQGLSAEWPHKECPKIFADGLGDNPRQIKRTVNVFLMLWNLAQKRKAKLGNRIKPVRLAKVVAIQTIYPELYELLKAEPRYLAEMEKYYRGKSVLPVPQDMQTNFVNAGPKNPQIEEELPPALAPYVSRQSVRRILTLHSLETLESNFMDLKPDEIKLYFTLARRAEVSESISFGTPTLFSEPQTIRIPAGEFLMGSTQEQIIFGSHNDDFTPFEQPQHEVELPEYLIGKYPITNREYQIFIKLTNSEAPRDWNGDQYPPEKGDHPVVNVSWKDAVAYCKWLSQATGKIYRLPTEAEWEKAARGIDGRIWPWGNKFDSSKANTKEANIGRTSSVGQYSPQGDSPYSCADMVGNVWEWCNDCFSKDEYKSRFKTVVDNPQGPEETGYRVVRGGSFYRTYGEARCAIRNGNRPEEPGEAKGFRIALSISS